jgi:hypothetical protein
LPAPNFVIIDGAAGLEKALGLVWSDALVQRCTVHTLLPTDMRCINDLDHTQRLLRIAASRIAESMIRLLRCAHLWDSLLANSIQVSTPVQFLMLRAVTTGHAHPRLLRRKVVRQTIGWPPLRA